MFGSSTATVASGRFLCYSGLAMIHAKNRVHSAIFALMSVALSFGGRPLPVQAELSPDAGIESEQYEVQQAEDARIAAEEAQKAKEAEEQKKIEAQHKAEAKKKAEAAAAKKLADAEAAA